MNLVLIIIGILIIIALIIFYQYNQIIKLKIKVQQSKSGIDVYCQQRFDLIPNLIETVKGYMNHEKGLLENLAQLRTDYNNTKGIKIGEELNKKLNSLIVSVENYPELKASEQFLNLQKNLEKMESQLQAARRIYNIDVTNYNIKINIIPFNIIAKLFGFKDEELFEVENKEITKNIVI